MAEWPNDPVAQEWPQDPVVAPSTAALAVSGAQADPDKTAKVIDLSTRMKVPPSVVEPDYEGARTQHRTNKALEAVNTNDKIEAWVNANALNGRMVGDDWDQLDRVSRSLSDLSQNSLLSHTWQGIKQGFGDQPVGITKEDFKGYPSLYNRFDDVIKPLLESPLGIPIKAVDAALNLVPRIFSAGIYGAAATGAAAYEQYGSHPDADVQQALGLPMDKAAWAARLERDLGIIGQGALIEPMFAPSAPYQLNKLAKEATKERQNEAKLSPVAASMLQEGVVPPVGLDYLVDQAHVEQNKIDGLKLDRVMQDSAESGTRERSAAAFAEFARLHTEGDLSLPAETIADLYTKAKKVPESGDGLFGYVLDLEMKIRAGMDSGVEVKIPIADYVAHTDPTVHEAVKDSLRLRPEGVTKEETKDLAKKKPEDYIEAYHGSPATFEAFDSQYMGSGEGAQSYAYGHYVAENQKVAEDYAKHVIPDAKLKRLAELEKRLEGLPEGNTRDAVNAEIHDLEQKEQGNLYRVRILHPPEAFLDWDKPLSEQSPQVKEALKKLGYDETVAISGEDVHRQLETELGKYGAPDEQGMHRSNGRQEVAKALAEAGIPGVRFLDQGSRADYNLTIKGKADGWYYQNGTGADEVGPFKIQAEAVKAFQDKQTRNYVVFNDKDLQITHRNDTPLGQAIDAAKKSLYLNPLFDSAKAAGLMTETELKQYSAKIEMAQDREAKKIVSQIEKMPIKPIPTNLRIEASPVPTGEAGLHISLKDEKDRTAYQATLLPYRPVDEPEGLHVQHIINDSHWLSQTTDMKLYKELGAAFYMELAKIAEQQGKYLVSGVSGETSRFAKSIQDKLVKEGLAERNEEYPNVVKLNPSKLNASQALIDNAIELALADDYADIMSQETRVLAKAGGFAPRYTRDEIKAFVKDNFAQQRIKDIGDWESLRRAVFNQGREAEKALLAGKFENAFKAKNRQLLAFMGMKELDAFQKKFDSVNKKINRVVDEPQIKSMDQAYLEQLHSVLAELGYPRNFEPTILPEPLAQFIADSNGQLAVASFLTDLKGRKIDDLTTQEFIDLGKSIDSLMHVGRQVQKLENVHGQADLQNVIFDIKKELDRFPLIEQPDNPTIRQRLGGLSRWVTGAHMLIERMFDYTDQFDPKGPITSFLDRPLRDANVKELVMTEEATKMLRGLRQFTDNSIYDKVENNLIPDTLSGTGLYNMNRQNLRQLMLNLGNDSNFKKLIEGFNIGEDTSQWHYTKWEAQQKAVMDFVHKNATEKDWKYVQGLWDLFAELKTQADEMQLRFTGVAADTIRAREVDTPFGKFAGGYAPLVYDRKRSNIEGHIASKGDIFDQNFFKATTPHGYTIARTQFAAPLDLTGVFMSNKIQSMIHDIAFREAVNNAGKLIYNQEFMNAITQKWGQERAALLIPWLKDIANVHNVDDSYAIGAARVASLIRQNITNALIAFNPGTYIKHGSTALAMSAEQVGAISLAEAMKDVGVRGIAEAARDLLKSPKENVDADFVQALKDITSPTDRGEGARQFVFDNSAVIRGRSRKPEDTVRGAYERSANVGPVQLLVDFRNSAMMLGRFPVALSDAVSAYPTWLAAYNRAMQEGVSHADAVFRADKEVSRAHGSSSVIDKARVMRTGEAMRWVTPLYNFWNHMMNKQLQAAWDVSAVARGVEEPGANAASLSNRLFWLVVIPIAVEEMAGPALDEHAGGYGVKALKAITRFFGSQIIGLRDVTNAVANGYEPSVGLIGTVMKGATDAAKDVYKLGASKAVSKEWLTHLATAIGFATGVGGPQIGKIAGFATDLATGKDRPPPASRGLVPAFNAYRQGFRTGHSKPRVFK